MKRFLSVLLVLSLLFCFASCGGEETVDSSNASAQNKPDESTQSQQKTNVEISENIALQYDDVYRFEGADEIVSEDPSVVKKALYAESTVQASGLSEKPVKVTVTYSDGSVKAYGITVSKAKINIAIVAGQSNATGETTGVQFDASKYHSVKCKDGTAFIWDGRSTVPVKIVGDSSTDGFRAALAEEWYRQSSEAKNTEKTVIVYAKDSTATPAEALMGFLDDNNSQANIKKTAELLNSCYDYYESGKGSKFYDIVNCGLYWLQGESDRSQSVEYYTEKFMSAWNRLKSDTKNRVKYCAFMRVRGSNDSDASIGPSGPAKAQAAMAQNNKDMYMASVVTENWTGNNQTVTKVDISKYHIFGEEQFKDIVSGNTLTEVQGNIYGGLHYGCLGYNIIGADAAANMYKALHK